MFIPYSSGPITTWLSNMILIVNGLISSCPLLCQCSLWINSAFYITAKPICARIIAGLAHGWTTFITHYSTAIYGDAIAASRIGIHIYRDDSATNHSSSEYFASIPDVSNCGYAPCLNMSLNDPADLLTFELPRDVLVLSETSPSPTIMMPYPIATTATSSFYCYSYCYCYCYCCYC